MQVASLRVTCCKQLPLVAMNNNDDKYNPNNKLQPGKLNIILLVCMKLDRVHTQNSHTLISLGLCFTGQHFPER